MAQKQTGQARVMRALGVTHSGKSLREEGWMRVWTGMNSSALTAGQSESEVSK